MVVTLSSRIESKEKKTCEEPSEDDDLPCGEVHVVSLDRHSQRPHRVHLSRVGRVD